MRRQRYLFKIHEIALKGHPTNAYSNLKPSDYQVFKVCQKMNKKFLI